jgi:hypothetical protein
MTRQDKASKKKTTHSRQHNQSHDTPRQDNGMTRQYKIRHDMTRHDAQHITQTQHNTTTKDNVCNSVRNKDMTRQDKTSGKK